ncbi:MAG: hypothetical protein JW724_06315 [Candidatus Altiarchaeota archaeon]|nr:hypothetical protein [Candidatus Altiarchaeota archaeon]
MRFKTPKQFFKYVIGFVVCLGIRLIPFRVPNVEPVMATAMPFGKKWGLWAGAFFGAASIVLYDLIRPTPGFARLGVWTLVTAVMYGLVGAAAGWWLSKRKSSIGNYVGFAVVATLLYDFITGPVMSSVIWNMTFLEALIGQIPFTLRHLAGNVVLAATVSPALYAWVVNNKRLEWDRVLAVFSSRHRS